MEKTQQSIKKLSAPGMIILFYLGAAIIGTLLLLLPVCNHERLRVVDAVFTAVSCLTGTGLVSVVPSVQFTLAGKIVMLLLIQAGGLAIVASLIVLVTALKQRIAHRERAAIQHAFDLGHLGGGGRFIRRVLLMTLVIEVIGAGIAAAVFIPVYGAGKGMWLGVFHAVSAFCNAGFDLLGGGGLTAFDGNWMLNLTMALLVIAGGLGFVTWFDLGRVFITDRKKHVSISTRAILIGTAVLLFTGAVVIAVTEWSNPDTIGSYSFGGKCAAAVYQSVMSRSGGFTIFDQGALCDSSKVFTALLMVIGGAPFGTAGGLKITTALILLFAAVAAVKGSRNAAFARRSIGHQAVRMAWLIALGFAVLLFMAVFIIARLEPFHFIDIVYESASAIGNVGLSAGITSGFSGISRMILACLMLAGRLCPVLVMLALSRKKDKKDTVRTLPKGHLLIG